MSQFLPIAVICERVVAGESQEDPEPGPQREEYLSGSIHPHLDKTERDITLSGSLNCTSSGNTIKIQYFLHGLEPISVSSFLSVIHPPNEINRSIFISLCSYLCSGPSVFNLLSGQALCQLYRNLVAAQLYAGRSEEEHVFGIKKKRAALDISE